MNADKYEPKQISEIIFGNSESQRRIENITNGIMPFPLSGKNSILLYGIYGTGKTTLAKLLPEAIEMGQTGQTLNMQAEFFACQYGNSGTSMLELVENQTNMNS